MGIFHILVCLFGWEYFIFWSVCLGGNISYFGLSVWVGIFHILVCLFGWEYFIFWSVCLGGNISKCAMDGRLEKTKKSRAGCGKVF